MNLLTVFEGAVENANYYEIKKTADYFDDYAFNALDVVLNPAHAKRMEKLAKIRTKGTNDYFHKVSSKLLEMQEEIDISN